MFLRRDKAHLPTADEALPGPLRTVRSPSPSATSCSARRSSRRSRTASSRSCSAWVASGVRSGSSGRADGVYTTAVGYAGGITPNPTYEETCSGRTGHTEAVLVVFDPKVTSLDEMLRVFWENHDPTQGMRQGNDIGTQYRSAIYTFNDDAGRARSRRRATMFQEQLSAAGYGEITTEIAPAPDVLLRRGLPPAVSGEEPDGVLRARRHRCELPDRSCTRRVA